MPLTDEQRKGFLEIKPTLAEDAVKTAEMATKDLDYDTNSADRAAARFDRADPDCDKLHCGYDTIKPHCVLQRSRS